MSPESITPDPATEVLPRLAAVLSDLEPQLEAVLDAIQARLEPEQERPFVNFSAPEQTALSRPSRRRARVSKQHPFDKLQDSFFRSLTICAAEQGMQEGELYTLVANFTTDEALQKAFVDALQYHIPSYKAFIGAEREVLALLPEKIESDPELVTELVDFLTNPKQLQQKSAAGLLSVLGQNWRNHKDSSVVEVLLKQYRFNLSRTSLRNYLQACLDNPDKWPKQNRILRFLQLFTQTDEASALIDEVAAKQDEWLPELAQGYKQFYQRSDASDKVRAELSRYAPRGTKTNLSLDELMTDWKELSEVAPGPIAGNTVKTSWQAAREMAKDIMNRIDSEKADETVEAEVPARPLEVATLRRIKDKGIYVVEAIGDETTFIEALLEPYVRGYPGVPLLKEDLLEAINYIRRPDSRRGIKKIHNQEIVTDSGKKYLVCSLKPNETPGVPCHSKAMRQTRIRFIRTDDHELAIIGIDRRDSKSLYGPKV